MKKLMILFIVCVSFIQTISGQKKRDLKLITSGKWYVEYVKTDDFEQYVPIEMKESNWMIFHPNGKHEVMVMDYPHIGKWKYSKKTKTIKTIEDDEVTIHEIIILSPNKFVFSTIQKRQGMLKIGLKK